MSTAARSTEASSRETTDADLAEHERLSREAAADAKKGHPAGLYVLFATEAWERFSYYGMRALLVLYLINYMEWQPAQASSVYKWYTSLVYLTPLLGGFLADRKLGLRLSIVIGGVLMAIGHFLMAFEALPFFYSALGFLIIGNGFFKPNISTLVGKMYRQGDPRRDGAFTIFYMGINLGAFAAPIVCGLLRKHVSYHAGFAAAGVGMVLGLGVFLLMQKRILADVKAAGNDLSIAKKEETKEGDQYRDTKKVDAEEADEKRAGHGGFSGFISRIFPWLLFVVAAAVPALYIVSIVRGQAKWLDAVMPIAFAGIAAWMGRNLLTIKGAARDKSTVIFVLFMFVVLFWMAFEQAGNALNIWADVNTNLHLFGWEYSAEMFQSVNPVLIFTLAPLFAAAWIWFARKSIEISTPAKMFAAMIFMALSFGAMVGGAIAENGTVSRVALASPPPGVDVTQLDAGRMTFDAGKHELSVRGVLAPFAVTEALDKTLDPKDHDALETLEKQASNATAKQPVHLPAPARMQSAEYVWPFDAKETDDYGVTKQGNDLVAVKPLTERAKAKLVASLADPTWRKTLDDLAKKSEGSRVSGIWLLLSYLLATLGELCLSPVGLSMVTKLAPARFASLFMGVWLLSSSVAQYVGGSIGESWGKITPATYFWIFVWTSIVGAIVLFVLVRPLKKLMHEVT
jgi:POT family proton-dependent oligopeptide transporter